MIAVLPAINAPGMRVIHANSGRVCCTMVHQVPAVQIVSPMAKHDKVMLATANNVLDNVKPLVLKSFHKFLKLVTTV